MSFENGIVGLIITLLGMLGSFVFNLLVDEIENKRLVKKRVKQSLTVGIIFTITWALIFAYHYKNRAKVFTKDENEILLYIFITTTVIFYLNNVLYSLVYKIVKDKSKQSNIILNVDETTNSDDVVNVGETANGDDVVNGGETANGDDVVNGDETANGDDIVNSDETTNSDDVVNDDETTNSDDVVNGEEKRLNLSNRILVNAYTIASLSIIIIIVMSISNLFITNPKSLTTQDSIICIEKNEYILPKNTTFKFVYLPPKDLDENEKIRLLDYKYEDTEYVLKKGTCIILFENSELYKKGTEKIAFKNNQQFADAELMTNENSIMRLNREVKVSLLSDVRVKVHQSNLWAVWTLSNSLILLMLLIIYYGISIIIYAKNSE